MRPGHTIVACALALLTLGVVMVTSASMTVDPKSPVTISSILLSRLTIYYGLALLTLALAAWLAPLGIISRLASRDQLFEIPKGTWARRMAGDKVEILPDRIDLTLGLNDTLLLRNLDEVPQQFGPVLIMPGQSFRLPFEAASTYSFACSAHASGQMSVVVSEHPAPGLPALRWRWRYWQEQWTMRDKG